MSKRQEDEDGKHASAMVAMSCAGRIGRTGRARSSMQVVVWAIVVLASERGKFDGGVTVYKNFSHGIDALYVLCAALCSTLLSPPFTALQCTIHLTTECDSGDFAERQRL